MQGSYTVYDLKDNEVFSNHDVVSESIEMSNHRILKTCIQNKIHMYQKQTEKKFSTVCTINFHANTD